MTAMIEDVINVTILALNAEATLTFVLNALQMLI